MTRYETPSRRQSEPWLLAIAWWRSCGQEERLSLRDSGLRSSVAIVEYFWRMR